jgi:DNA-3-methyladenine glycosylase I
MEKKTAPEKVKVGSLDKYLEIMSKSVLQSGMSWKVVNSKWEGIREGFSGFDINKIAAFSGRDIERLLGDSRIIRNRKKVEAIVSNARTILEKDAAFKSFRRYLSSLGDFDSTIKALGRDFSFLGPTGAYVFLHVVGEKVPPHDEFRSSK